MRTVKYYHVIIYKNNVQTDIPFMMILDSIQNMKWNNTVRKIKEHPMAMFPYPVMRKEHKTMRIVPIGTFREDYKPFLGQTKTSHLEEIETGKDVVELATMVYCSDTMTAGIVSSRESANIKDIEIYYSSYFPKCSNEEYTVKFEPINYNSDIKEIYNTHEIRNIEIHLKVNQVRGNLAINNQTFSNGILDMLRKSQDSTEELGANVVKLCIGTGKKRGTMRKEEIIKFVELLNIDNDEIEKIEIKYVNKFGKTESIDLKHLKGHLSDQILKDVKLSSPDPITIGDHIFSSYISKRNSIIESFNELLKNKINNVNTPVLIEEPPTEYKIIRKE